MSSAYIASVVNQKTLVMYEKVIAVVIGLMLAMTGVTRAGEIVSLKTDTGTFGIGDNGQICALTRNGDGKNYFPSGQQAPVLQIHIAGKDYPPDSATWDAATGLLTLHYDAVGAQAVVEIIAKPSHVTLELVNASPLDRIDMVRWGPYPTTINRVVGELVGVVRDTEFAVGIQSLNAKTQGGEPCGDDFQEHRYHSPDAVPHDGILRVSSTPKTHFCGVAMATAFGSILQMHCWEHDRGEPFFNQTKRLPYAPAIPMKYPGDTVVGTKIALFACPEPAVLGTLGAIELAENLPHPMADGVWIKADPYRGPVPILCFEFDEKNLDEFIALAKACHIDWIYHNSPWATWGHFPPKPGMFPRGVESFKECAAKIHRAGLHLGVHTLSTFITADDAYVTVPGGHPDLARTKGPGSGHVVSNYGKKIYFGNKSLSAEIARNCAHIVNEAQLDQFEFDGVESNWSTGLGGYGRDLFYDAFNGALSPARHNRVMVAGSNLDNYGWHTYYGANWGEPWYDSFRKSMLDYRLDMVRLYARNYLVPMLGQFFIHPEGEKVEDIEWLMALSSGYNAGFSLTFGRNGDSYMHGQPTSETARLRPGNLNEMTRVISTWQDARVAHAFPAEIRAQLQDENREFHLEAAGENAWDLRPVYPTAGDVGKNGNRLAITNPRADAAFQLNVYNETKQPVRHLKCASNGGAPLTLCDELLPGQRLKYAGGTQAIVYDNQWKKVRSCPVDLTGIKVQQGKVELTFDWAGRMQTQGNLRVEARMVGDAIRLKGKVPSPRE
jgi:hypothetical protein